MRALLELSKGGREWSLQCTAKQSNPAASPRGGSVRERPCSAARRKGESSSLHCKAAELCRAVQSRTIQASPHPSFRPISIRRFPLHLISPGSSQRRKVLTRIHPLHSIRKGIIRHQIVSPPPGIREHRVRSHALQPSSQPHGDNSNG